MNYRNTTPKDLEQLTELFDTYRMFYRKTTDLEGAKTFLEERISSKSGCRPVSVHCYPRADVC